MNARKLLLIEPPFYRLYKETISNGVYPMALGYLSGAVTKETDWDVRAYNADFSPVGELERTAYLAGPGFQHYLRNLESHTGTVWQEVRRIIEGYAPDVVGISTTAPTFASTRIVARMAKESAKRPLVVIGGPHPSLVGAEVLDCPDIDAAVRGEGEETLVELLRAIEHGRSFEGIGGLVFRKDGQIIENPTRGLLRDLDALPFPHEHAPQVLQDFQSYPLDAFQRIFSARGCPFNCFFCSSRSVWTRRDRHRSTPNIVREIQALRAWGINEFYFADDTFGCSRERIRETCRALREEGPGVRWGCEIHVKLIDDDIVGQMRRSGCSSILLGVESGCDRVLKDMRKGCKVEEAMAAARTIQRNGVLLSTFIMVGFPTETEESLRDTIRVVRAIDPDSIIYSNFMPYPGTEAFEHCQSNGTIDATFDVSRHNHQSPENYFCPGINRARFRELASEVEQMVSRHNYRKRMRRLLSRRTLTRLGALGLREASRRLFTYVRAARR
jgi:radical SAM superfamily enzyme YgiQ (UPF0313 family)